MKTTDSLIVSYDFTEGHDMSVLIVGRQKRKFVGGKIVQHMDVVNAFQGQEANDIWERLNKKGNGGLEND